MMVSGDDECICGHTREQHIYDEGACRPGFVCPSACTEFVEKRSKVVPRKVISTEPQVVIPMSEYTRLKETVDAVEASNARTERIHQQARDRYAGLTYEQWREEVETQTCYACQEFVPPGENSSLLALLELGRIAFFASPEWRKGGPYDALSRKRRTSGSITPSIPEEGKD